MNSPMSNYIQMRRDPNFREEQNIPEWFRNMTMSQGNQMSGYPMMAGSNFMKSFRMDDQGHFMAQFMSHESHFEQETYQRTTSSQIRGNDYFPFYRFGNWSSPMHSEEMARHIRIQTSRPICDQYGDYYNLGASFMNGGNYHFMKYSRSGDFDIMNPGNNYQVIGSIPSRFQNHLGYFHAYGMTDNYLVFCEQPLAFNMNKFRQTELSGDSLEYMQGEYNHFYIIDKRTGRRMEMSYVTDKPYFFYNFINCYEYENRVVIDVMGFDESDFGSSMRSTNFFRDRYTTSKIMRFLLPLSGQGMSLNYENSNQRDGFALQNSNQYLLRPEYLFRESGLMYPFINPHYNFRKNQYTYGMRGNSLMKFDTEYGKTQIWRCENDYWRPYRSMFVANPSGRFEDDGIIISAYSDSSNCFSRNFVVFIDARSMEELSRFHYDGPFPFENFDLFPQYFM